jgi:amidase
VDAVVYPAFLTGVGNNDAASAVLSSDRASGVLTQTIGLPTAIIPIGTNAAGQSNNVQIMGRAWDDLDVLGYGYAIEQAKSEPALRTTFAPSLPYAGPAQSTTSLSLASTALTYGTTTTATVTVASDPQATGTVSVGVAGKKVTGTLVDGKAVVSLPSGIPVGTYLVTASYAGSSTVAASAATATVAVRSGRPQVSVALVRKKVGGQRHGRLRVTVVSGASTSLALVYDGRRLLTSAHVGPRSVVRLPKLKAGKHRLAVTVVGDAAHASASSNTVVLRVLKKR